jgi:site-specific recombinase XerD
MSSYVARHSWATIAKNSGSSVEFLSEALGHSSVKVTQGYLKSFERSTREAHAEKMEDAVYSNKAV